jgi:hypothetical protein
MVVASQLFPRLAAAFTPAGGSVDYHRLFLIPTAIAIGGILLLLVGFVPPTRGPVEAGAANPLS